MPRPSKKAADKQELAERLGVPVTDIFTREEVAAMMVPPTNKNALAKNPKSFPPFFSKGERNAALYPRHWIDEHRREGKVTRAGRPVEGAQPWPAPLPPPPPVDLGKRDNALGLLDAMGVKVRPGTGAVAAEEIEEYRKNVSGDA